MQINCDIDRNDINIDDVEVENWPLNKFSHDRVISIFIEAVLFGSVRFSECNSIGTDKSVNYSSRMEVEIEDPDMNCTIPVDIYKKIRSLVENVQLGVKHDTYGERYEREWTTVVKIVVTTKAFHYSEVFQADGLDVMERWLKMVYVDVCGEVVDPVDEER